MMSGARTGSEVGLFNYISRAGRRRIEMAVACPRDGELLRELPAGVETYVHRPEDNLRLTRRVLRKLSPARAREMDSLALSASRRFRPDAWYVNTIIQPELLRLARREGVPCALHTHELEQMLWGLGAEDARDVVEVPRLVVAGSKAGEAVVRRLGREHGTEVCYETIDGGRIRTDAAKSVALRARLGVGEGFVWAMSGSLDPNKNPVLFVELAKDLLDRGRDAHFVWIGGSENAYGVYARRTAEALGVSRRVHFVGAQADDYYSYLDAADAFVLTSFKESFSIVTVEAAYLGKPVVARDCGGVSEILTDRMGTIVRSWNRADLVAAMGQVMDGRLSFDAAAARARAREFDVAARVEHWERTLEKYFAP